MAMQPKRIRQLPEAHAAKDSDAFPVSQMDDAGVPTTRITTRAQIKADILAATPTVAGPRGDIGPQGVPGPKGDTGAQGPIGLTGPKGDAGSQGAAGSKGDTGVKGDTGAKGDPGLTFLGNITVSETLLVSLSLGMKRKSYALAGVLATDKLLVVPNGAPSAGCEAINAYPASAGNVSIGYYVPALGIGATYTIPVSIYRMV